MPDEHAGTMDGVYRWQRHIYDVSRKYFLLGRDRLLRELAPPAGGHVLEIGCGTGRNLLLAARRYPEAHFYGLDISEMMLRTARAKLARHPEGERIRLALADATSFDAERLFGHRRFERIYISYSLSMIPDWRKALAMAAAHLTEDGCLLAVDFGQQEGLPEAWRRALFAWIGNFHVTPRPDLAEAMAALGGHRKASVTVLYRGYAWLGRSDRRAA
jgi:S-adenosylmethionine-diacylgycerolhomoserine-N-methlytransferase